MKKKRRREREGDKVPRSVEYSSLKNETKQNSVTPSSYFNRKKRKREKERRCGRR